MTLRYDLAPVILPVDAAVPFGLLLHELLSNAIQHAFPRDKVGEITITLHSNDNGEKDLWINDNGAGLPQGFDFEANDSVGIEIIKLIAEHELQGTVLFEPAEVGTTVHVHFIEPYYPQRI